MEFFIITVWYRLFFILEFHGLCSLVLPLLKVYDKCMYKIFQADNQETQFPSVFTKPSIEITFHLSKVGCPEVILSTIHTLHVL